MLYIYIKIFFFFLNTFTKKCIKTNTSILVEEMMTKKLTILKELGKITL